MVIVPKGRGVFLVDSTGQQPKVFSFDTFLEIEFVSGTERSHIANLALFPSTFFKHDPQNTPEFKDADILRISIVDSVRYADFKTGRDGRVLFS